MSGRNTLHVVAIGAVVFMGAHLIAGCSRAPQSASSPPAGSSAKARQVPEFGAFNPATHKGPVGSIIVPDDRLSYALNLMPIRTNRVLIVETKHGAAKAPTGRYRVIGYSAVSRKNPQGEAYGRPKSAEITVKANSTTKLKLGGPYTAKVSVTKLRGDKVSIDLITTDCAGNECMIRGRKPPRFQVISKSGEVLQEGAFEYG